MHPLYHSAYEAHYNTSFHPEKRAERECTFYDEICAEFAGKPGVIAKFDRLFRASLAAKARCASSMITGPARFPVEKNRKAMQREHKISGEMLGYIERVRKAMKQDEYYAAHPEARPIMSGDSDALARLREKLAGLEKTQANMVAVNKIIRKQPIDTAALIALLGNEERVAALLTPDFCGRTGFAPYMLSNNNANIRATRMRIAELEKSKDTPAQECTVNGARVVENTEAMRLQLFFDDKPERKIIDLLKAHAFKWAPTSKAWQRQLNPNALYAFKNSILPTLEGTSHA